MPKSRSKKITKNNKKTGKRKLFGGGCGCSQNTKKAEKRGGCSACGLTQNGGFGPATYNGGLNNYMYPQNNYANDPNNTMLSERFTRIHSVSGGKKQKRTRRRKMRGGDPLLGSTLSMSNIASFGTSAGSLLSNAVVNNGNILNTSLLSQPVNKSVISSLV